MISPDALNAWRADHPWTDDDQVEQFLIMTRVAIEIASHSELRDRSRGAAELADDIEHADTDDPPGTMNDSCCAEGVDSGDPRCGVLRSGS